MEVQLIVIGGKASKREITLKLPAIVGRSREADLTIAHPMVSRQHCQLFEADGLLMVRDLGSLNGTVVAGQRVSEAAIPPDGEFTIGPLSFRAKYEYQGDLSAKPPPKSPGAKKGRRGKRVEDNLADSRWQAEAAPRNPQTLEVPLEGQRPGPSLSPAGSQATVGPPPDALPLASAEPTADVALPDAEDALLRFEDVTEADPPLDLPPLPPAPPSGADEEPKADAAADAAASKRAGAKSSPDESFEDEVLKDFLQGLQ
jgi:predicted component of type VI protein secretion system